MSSKHYYKLSDEGSESQSNAGASTVVLEIPPFPGEPNLALILQQDRVRFVKEYLSLPALPYGSKIKIDKIISFNYDPVRNQHLGLITYESFRSERPDEFPECQDPQLDYENSDEVAPVLIVSGEMKYRVKMLLWFPLCDVATRIISKQSQLKRKLLPIEVFIDERDQFMMNLFNL